MQTYVRRELTSDFVAQPEAELEVRETGPDAVLRVVFAESSQFQFGLQNELLRDQDFVFTGESSRSTPSCPM